MDRRARCFCKKGVYVEKPTAPAVMRWGLIREAHWMKIARDLPKPHSSGPQVPSHPQADTDYIFNAHLVPVRVMLAPSLNALNKPKTLASSITVKKNGLKRRRRTRTAINAPLTSQLKEKSVKECRPKSNAGMDLSKRITSKTYAMEADSKAQLQDR
ncbi:unnamed protein product [Clonostachys rhizophaga]|uniref:Uncharacterized protein n=1 Tax=Clonostachys rhizophaga TaxID=160324 RepID=A0A9N9W652_9HYPO|nr:unnamed protein product [Clonostachys rhizophaga]